NSVAGCLAHSHRRLREYVFHGAKVDGVSARHQARRSGAHRRAVSANAGRGCLTATAIRRSFRRASEPSFHGRFRCPPECRNGTLSGPGTTPGLGFFRVNLVVTGLNLKPSDMSLRLHLRRAAPALVLALCASAQQYTITTIGGNG